MMHLAQLALKAVKSDPDSFKASNHLSPRFLIMWSDLDDALACFAWARRASL